VRPDAFARFRSSFFAEIRGGPITTVSAIPAFEAPERDARRQVPHPLNAGYRAGKP
jgi:hypothetical protein